MVLVRSKDPRQNVLPAYQALPIPQMNRAGRQQRPSPAHRHVTEERFGQAQSVISLPLDAAYPVAQIELEKEHGSRTQRALRAALRTPKGVEQQVARWKGQRRDSARPEPVVVLDCKTGQHTFAEVRRQVRYSHTPITAL